MGFDYVPGDMIAALTAEGIGPLEEITLAYSVRSLQMTRGTTLSGIGMLTASELEYVDGALRPGDRSVNRGSFRFPPPVGPQPMARYPSGEPIMVPRHVEVRTVRTMLTAATMAPPRMVPALPALLPVMSAAMRTPLKSLAARLVERRPEGPEPDARKAATFMIVCEARPSGGGPLRRGVISGSDVYGLTAVTIAEGALRLAAEATARAAPWRRRRPSTRPASSTRSSRSASPARSSRPGKARPRRPDGDRREASGGPPRGRDRPRQPAMPRLRRAAVRLGDGATGRAPGAALRALRPRGARAAATERQEAAAAASAAAAGGEAPNRASLQAWIGGSGWSALEPERRFLFTPESLRLLGHPGARPRPAIAAMWQTLLNSFTFGHDVALGRLGRATATPASGALAAAARPRDQPAGDAAGLPDRRSLAELLAAAAGRGGRLRMGRCRRTAGQGAMQP